MGIICGAAAGWILWPDAESVDIPATALDESKVSAQPQANAEVDTGNSAPTPLSSPAAAVSQPKTIEGDLALLQGTWRLADVQSDPAIPLPPGAVEEIKKARLSIDGSIAIVYLNTPAPGRSHAAFELVLNPTQPLPAIDIKPISGDPGKGFPGLGIYRLENNQLQLCICGQGRPAELKTDFSKKQFLATLKKLQPGEIQEPPPRMLFDYKAWILAHRQLEAKGISSGVFEPVQLESGLTQEAFIDTPPLVDGMIPMDVWEIISPVSHVILRTGWRESEPKTAITDQTLRQISQHQGLLGLLIASPSNGVTAQGLLALKNCPNLRYFTIEASTAASPQLFNWIGHLQELRSLYVGQTKLSRKEISVIVQLKKLERLGLANTGLTDDEISMLAARPELLALDLSRTSMTDKGLAALSGLTNLEHLTLQDTSITDIGLESLRGLTKLEFLSLQGTKITDKGLESLHGLTRIKQLFLQGTNVSPQGVEAFKRSHPECGVY